MNNEVNKIKEVDEFFLIMMKEHIRKVNGFKDLNSISKKNKVAMIGDSITEGFPIMEVIDNKGLIYNRGISGYKAYQLKENMKDIVLDLQPNTIFVLIGTNDIADDKPNTEILDSIKSITSQIKNNLPNTKVYVLSVLPINEKEEYKESTYIRTNKIINELNEMIYNLVSRDNSLEYLDANSLMLDGDQLNEEYTYDGIHLSSKGYIVLGNFIKNYIK